MKIGLDFIHNNKYQMIKQQAKDNLTTKDELVEQMVAAAYKNLRNMGQFQTVNEIFGKLPISRIQKEQYQFLFDSVKQNVDQIISQQDLLRKILDRESELIKKIQIRSFKDSKVKYLDTSRQAQATKNNLITLSNYDFDNLVESCFTQKLTSSRPIFKSILFFKNQERGKDYYGEQSAFLPDQTYINFKDIQNQIGDIRLLLQDEPPLKKYQLQFRDQNEIDFKSRNFPNNYEIDKRAQTLAKLFLLHLYREEGRKAKQIYKSNEVQQNKQRQIRKIKQQMDVQKIKEGEMIEEMDLIKQVYKILMLIQKKMNEQAFAQFTNKNGEKATNIKKSLEKIKKIVHQQQSAKNKLKILITYKHKKGW